MERAASHGKLDFANNLQTFNLHSCQVLTHPYARLAAACRQRLHVTLALIQGIRYHSHPRRPHSRSCGPRHPSNTCCVSPPVTQPAICSDASRQSFTLVSHCYALVSAWRDARHNTHHLVCLPPRAIPFITTTSTPCFRCLPSPALHHASAARDHRSCERLRGRSAASCRCRTPQAASSPPAWSFRRHRTRE